MPSDRFQQKGNHSLFGLRGNKKSRFTRTRLKAFIESVRTVLSQLFSDLDQVAPANDSDTYFLFKHHVRLIMFSSQPRKFRKNNIRPVASLALGWGKRTSPRSLRNFNILASARCVSECGCKEKQKLQCYSALFFTMPWQGELCENIERSEMGWLRTLRGMVRVPSTSNNANVFDFLGFFDIDSRGRH